MITEHCDLYVLGRGFVKALDLNVQDKVYSLDGAGQVEITEVESVSSEYISGKINRIDSGAHNVDLTDDARSLYYSENHGYKLISFNQIPAMTPNKDFQPNKYLPVLSSRESGPPNCSLTELEYVARMLAVHQVDRPSFDNIINRCSGSDALVLIDMLEFWCSFSPGTGWFERAQVKSRSHEVRDRHILDELSRVAVLAGFTAATTELDQERFGLKVSYEPSPIPGSRPKNEKYFKTYYTGNIVNINAKNRPIMGRSRNRIFYLPTSSTL